MVVLVVFLYSVSKILEKQRDAEEIAEMDAKNKITEDMVGNNSSIHLILEGKLVCFKNLLEGQKFFFRFAQIRKEKLKKLYFSKMTKMI